MAIVRVWTGREATVLRQALRLSIRDFAARFGVGARTVSNWAARQDHITPRPELQAVLDAALDQASDSERTRFELLLRHDDGEEADTDRRQFITTAVGASGLLATASGVLATGGMGGEAAEDEQLLQGVTTTYRRLESRTPSRSLVSPVRAHLDLVMAHAARRQSRRAQLVASETAGLAGWLYLDMDEVGSARRQYRLATRAARMSGHRLLPAYMQASWGSFEAQTGNPTVGLQLIREARQDVQGHPTPAIALVWLEVMEAAALADGHDDRALDTLKHAERRLSKALACDSIWPWLFAFDERKLTGYRAVVSAKLGRAVAARAAFESLGTDVQAPKTRALADLAYAEVLAAQGDVERACVVAGRAVEDGGRYGSDHILHTAARLRSRLGDRHSGVVASFDRKLQAAWEVGA